MGKSPKNSPKAAPVEPVVEVDNVVRVSRTHTPAFYLKAATDFMHGVKGRDGAEPKKYDTIVVSALGAAIPTAAQVANLLEAGKIGTISKVQTAFTALDSGKRPQLLISISRNKKFVPPPPEERTSAESAKSNKSGKAGSGGAKAKFANGPPCPERLNTEKLTKKMAKVRKEGGKRGVEIEGQADMGGLKYFCTKVLEPAGDVDMLLESVKAMNEKSDPSEEERKGGSGRIGKTVLSMADQNDLCIVCYVPPEENYDAVQWMKAIFERLMLPKDFKPREDSNAVYAQVQITNDESKNIYALKLRDYVIQHANGVLLSKGLIPDIESDEDEMVFGDDDFDM